MRNVEVELGRLDKAPQAGGSSQTENGVIVLSKQCCLVINSWQKVYINMSNRLEATSAN